VSGRRNSAFVRLARRLWPAGLAGRTVVLLLGSMLLLHLGSVWLYENGLRGAAETSRERQIAERLSAAKRAVAALPEGDRDRTAHALAAPGLDVHWSPVAVVLPAAGQNDARLAELRRRLLAAVPELGEVRLAFGEEGAAGVAGHLVVGSLGLQDGSWINFSAALFRAGLPGAMDHATITSTTAMAAGIIVVAVLLVHWLTRPLQHLAYVAKRIGRDPVPVPVAEDGPTEAVRLARAFNAMQRRIHRMIQDRTQALAAVSHDLRTPIQRLRLRAGFIEDEEVQARMEADLAEMEAMIEATLAYLRGDDAEDAEPRRTMDLAATLQALCGDAADAGQDASYDGPTRALVSCRPVALKRAFANLVGNAIAYGGTARVRLSAEAGQIRVEIEDDGPGIPDAELERVFEPFRRLEESRNRVTGGVGLGLTIARQAVEAEGGQLVLGNRPGGGLTATATLPPRRETQPIAATARRDALPAQGCKESRVQASPGKGVSSPQP
jgi:signal transduction histidine kinase